MSVVNINNFQLLGDIIQRSFLANNEDRIKNAFKTSGLVHVDRIPDNSGASRRIEENLTGLLYASYIPESSPFPKDKRQIGYYKDTVANKFGLEINISLEARRLGKKEVELRFIENLTKAYADRVDLDLTMQFAEGHNATYTDLDGRIRDITTGDGLPLWSAVHTLTGSGTTYRNTITNNPALSQSAIELALDIGRVNTRDNLGNQLGCTFDTLFITDAPDLNFAARRILRSTSIQNDGSATAYGNENNNGVINVFQNMFNLVVLPRLDMRVTGVQAVSKDNNRRGYWGLANSQMHTNVFHEYMAPELFLPNKGNNQEDVSNLDYIFKIAGIYGQACVSGRYLLMSKGDGTPG